MLRFAGRFPDVTSRYRRYTRLIEIITVTTECVEINLPVKGVIDLICRELIIIPIPSAEALMVDKIFERDIGIRVACNKSIERSW